MPARLSGCYDVVRKKRYDAYGEQILGPNRKSAKRSVNTGRERAWPQLSSPPQGGDSLLQEGDGVNRSRGNSISSPGLKLKMHSMSF